MSKYRICPRCLGDGWQDEYRGIECPNCNGEGEVEIFDYTSASCGQKHSVMQDWEYELLQSSSDENFGQ